MVLRPVWLSLRRVLRWQHFPLAIIVAATLGLRLATVSSPPQLVFDENYYVMEARGILAGWGPLLTEHPPLGKLFIISGMRLFGDNAIGWRFFPIVFGTVSIVLFYLICASLRMPRRAQIFATVLLAFENLTFLQSGMAMLDVFSLTLMLGSFLLYLKGRQWAAGLSLSASALAKLTGVLGGLVIFLHWLFSWIARKSRPNPVPPPSKEGEPPHVGDPLSTLAGTNETTEPMGLRARLLPVVIMAASAIACFFALYPVLNYALAHTWSSPFSLVEVALGRSSGITFGTGNNVLGSRPLDWLTGLQIWFYNPNPQYLAVVTPTVWVLVIPSVLYMVFKAIKGSEAALFGLAWFLGIYLVWIPIVSITDRMTYLYYFYPAIGAICIGIGLGMNDLMNMGRAAKKKVWERLSSTATYGYMGLHLGIFIVLSPIFWPLVNWFPVGK